MVLRAIKNPTEVGLYLSDDCLFVSRFWSITLSNPLEILLVVCIVWVKGDASHI
jgi:hypothetical protein